MQSGGSGWGSMLMGGIGCGSMLGMVGSCIGNGCGGGWNGARPGGGMLGGTIMGGGLMPWACIAAVGGVAGG